MPCAKKSSTRAKLQHVGQTTFGSTKIKSAETDNVSEYNPSDDDKTLSEDEEGGTLDSITTNYNATVIFCISSYTLKIKLSTLHSPTGFHGVHIDST